jgi:hypothetical protein
MGLRLSRTYEQSGRGQRSAPPLLKIMQGKTAGARYPLAPFLTVLAEQEFSKLTSTAQRSPRAFGAALW